MKKLLSVVKIFIRKRTRHLWWKLRSVIDVFYNIERRPNIIFNVNYSPLRHQKRVALVYLYNKNVSKPDSILYHPNSDQHFIILNSLIKEDYIIDIYSCLDNSIDSSLLTDVQYDVILGFGSVYLQLCQLYPLARKVLFVTENSPWIVRDNFKQRVDYYYQRHKKEIPIVARMGFYTDDMFEISDEGIVMSGSYNISKMKEKLPSISQVFVNAICPRDRNSQIDFNNKKKFVWFGSAGIIHKGLDILIDAFAGLPDFQLDIYGAPEEEIKYLESPTNVYIHKRIDVMSESFIKEVVNEHVFVLSLSCSEGMMSGIATCMLAGLIPIVTKETGYDDCPYVLFFDDWHIDIVQARLKESVEISPQKLEMMSKGVKDWANSHNTNNAFDIALNSII